MISWFYNKVALISPWLEVQLRKFYWNHVKTLKKYSTNKTNRIHRSTYVDFEKIIDYLTECGIGKGDLIVMHSSYGNLKPLSIDNNQIIDRLLSLVGDEGTLAAPVIRKYAEEESMSVDDLMGEELTNVECVYDVKKTPVTSGVLGITLMKHPQSVTSEFPLNPLTAVGRLAASMMEHNLDGECPSAHGEGSCWKFCADNDAFVIYLGIDFGHHITMQQVFTEAYPQNTPPNFYIRRPFIIIKDGHKRSVIVKERRLRFTKVLAELNVRNDIIKSGIVKTALIDDIPVSVFKAKDLLEYYGRQRKYYPYYIR